MLAAQQEAEDAQIPKYCDITIVDLNNREIPIKVSAYPSIEGVSGPRRPPLYFNMKGTSSSTSVIDGDSERVRAPLSFLFLIIYNVWISFLNFSLDRSI